MRNRALDSGQRVTEETAAVIKAMVQRGDRAHDVASFFGLNPGRVAEVANGHRFPSTEAASADTLPPAGPYLGPLLRWQRMQRKGADR